MLVSMIHRYIPITFRIRLELIAFSFSLFLEFLASVQNDIRKARKFFIEADRLEEQSEQIRKDTGKRRYEKLHYVFDYWTSISLFVANLSGDGTEANGIDDKNDAIVVINDQGVILTVNENCKKIFGYHESELVNKNVSILMPAPYKQQHNSYLQNYKQSGEDNFLSRSVENRKAFNRYSPNVTTGTGHVIGKVRQVEGEHKKGHTIPIEIRISKVDTPQVVTYRVPINEWV